MTRQPLAKITLGHGNIVRQTEKAILFNFGGGDVWMPKSQIELDLPESPIKAGTLTLPIWLARKSGLWGYDNTGHQISGLV